MTGINLRYFLSLSHLYQQKVVAFRGSKVNQCACAGSNSIPSSYILRAPWTI